MFGWFKQNPLKDDDNWVSVESNSLLEHSKGVFPFIIGPMDATYDLPNQTVIDYVLKELYWIARATYKTQAWDCDDFTMMFRVKAHELTAKNGRNIPIGNVCYNQDNRGFHMIGAILNDLGKWIFVEPQTMKVVTLSETEINSIRYVIV